jgi:hypothetical protein
MIFKGRKEAAGLGLMDIFMCSDAARARANLRGGQKN